MNDALTKPIDSTVIANLASIARFCAASNGSVPCIDQTYQNLPDGKMESMFASGGMATDVGYSERSFFMQQARSQPPYVVQMPYDPSPVPVMFVDALVRNKAICSNDPCATDVRNFANYLSGTKTRAMIALSQDIEPNPWRRLLPATAAFYSLQPVQNDPVYASIIPLIKTMQPAPTSITAAVLNERAVSVCGTLKAQSGLSSYVCPTPAPQHS
jgi:hypothetical protein